MPISTKMARAKAEAVYWDNYVKYLETVDDRGSGVGKGKKRPKSVVLHIAPFGLDINTATDLLKVSANATTWNTHQSKWTNAGAKYARDDWGDTAAENSLDIRYRPARVVIRDNVSDNGIKTIAKGTKRPYLKYGGTSSSIPFGRALGANNVASSATEAEIFTLIYNGFLVSGVMSDGRRVTHVKEKGK